MIVVDIPVLFERPRHIVLAFMAGLSKAAGRSGRSYFEELALIVVGGAGADA